MDNNKDAPAGYASAQEFSVFSIFDPFGVAAATMKAYAFLVGWYDHAISSILGFTTLAANNVLSLSAETLRIQAGLHRKELHLPDNLDYVYLEGGQGDPLLLLHHFGGTKDFFAPVAAHLTPHFRVIIPDQIGFGESAHPIDADYGPTAQAKRLHAFVRALGITDLHLGGSSMGGQIAMTYGTLFPEEVKSLWLLCPTGVWTAPRSDWQKTVEMTGENPLLVKTPSDFQTLLQMAVGSPIPPIPAPLLNVLAAPRIKNYALEKRIFEATFRDSVEERVAGLTTPTLIVWGRKDQMVNVEAARTLKKLMPRSQVIVMEEAAHMPMVEDPLQAARDYLKFRATLDSE